MKKEEPKKVIRLSDGKEFNVELYTEYSAPEGLKHMPLFNLFTDSVTIKNEWGLFEVLFKGQYDHKS